MEPPPPHFAILSSPGMGHLIPVLELANRLTTHHNSTVTILVVTTTTSPAESLLLPPTTTTITTSPTIIQLPPVDVSSSSLPPNAAVVTQLCSMMRLAVPSVRSALLRLRPTALIVDLFGSQSLPLADELHVAKYVFVTSNAWFAALTCHCHVLDTEVVGQYVDQIEPLKIPGCKPIRPEDVVDPMVDRNDQQYKEYARMGVEYYSAHGILLNTWEDVERQSFNALRSMINVPVYPIGPLTKPVEPEVPNTELMNWLDEQLTESVLYVSFGSGGTLSGEQLTELAWGLEMSQQRFIWVVRPPVDGQADASFFSAGNGNGAVDFLPDGFVNRTHHLGLVVPLWAPQMKILSHPSVGGFLSHCGWNSTLESLINGVPMIAWPLYAEQRMNAAFLTEDLGVAVRPKALPTKEVVRREEVEEMVRSVMEVERGKGMRERAKEVRISGEKALGEGGSSYNSLCEVIKDSQLRILESTKF